MAEPEEEKRAFRLGWSAWRRAHQAVATRYRKASRAAKGRALSAEAAVEDRAGLSTTTLSAEGAPLTDEEWEHVEPLLPHKPPSTGRRYHDHRTVYWAASCGLRARAPPWREMPEEYGKWETAYRRYELWLKQGLWQRILEALGDEELPGTVTKDAN